MRMDLQMVAVVVVVVVELLQRREQKRMYLDIHMYIRKYQKKKEVAGGNVNAIAIVNNRESRMCINMNINRNRDRNGNARRRQLGALDGGGAPRIARQDAQTPS